MNVLIYVMTMLFVLAAMTYAKLDNFRTLIGTQVSFAEYMSVTERLPFKEISETWYHRLKVTSNDKGGNKDNQAPNASCRLCLYPILSRKAADADPEAYKQIRQIAKQLMAQLYAEQAFYKELAEQRSNFLDEILDDLARVAEKAIEQKKLKNGLSLSNLELSPKEIDNVFYLMLKGLPITESAVPAKDLEKHAVAMEVSTLDTDDEAVAYEERNEAKAQEGYRSLVDYITVMPKYKQIRVFLAPRVLLMAIYQDAEMVENIIQTRYELYKQLKAQPEAKGQIQPQLKQQFETAFNLPQYTKVLNFTVSNTNPKDYN